jgi:hypothetical protein
MLIPMKHANNTDLVKTTTSFEVDTPSRPAQIPI